MQKHNKVHIVNNYLNMMIQVLLLNKKIKHLLNQKFGLK